MPSIRSGFTSIYIDNKTYESKTSEHFFQIITNLLFFFHARAHYQTQTRLQGFVTDQMEPLQKLMGAFAKCGQELVGSAASGVDTANLEKEMDQANEKWTALQQKVS